MIDKSLLEECKKQGGHAEALAIIVEYMMQKPQWGAFVVLTKVMANWNKQLIDNPIDLFSDASDKSFDRGKKYLDDIESFASDLEALQKKLTESEIEAAKEAATGSISVTEQARRKVQQVLDGKK